MRFMESSKEVEVKYITSVDDIPGCHLLFVSEHNRERLGEVVEAAGKSPILTIGDSKGFAEKGIHINFYVTEGNVRFAINVNAAKTAGLSVSHHLLRVAKIGESEEDNQ